MTVCLQAVAMLSNTQVCRIKYIYRLIRLFTINNRVALFLMVFVCLVEALSCKSITIFRKRILHTNFAEEDITRSAPYYGMNIKSGDIPANALTSDSTFSTNTVTSFS